VVSRAFQLLIEQGGRVLPRMSNFVVQAGATPAPEVLLYSRKLAAVALSISVRSLDYLIERGELPTKRIGNKVLIPAADLRRYAKADHPEPIRPGTF